MGWASGGLYFDLVAKAMVDLNADEAMKRAVLKPLFDMLRDGDWDTVEESMDEFRHDPVIMSILMEDGRWLYAGDNTEGGIGYDQAAKEWFVRCLGASCGSFLHRRALTAEGHDELAQLWAAHDRDFHGGDGVVPEWLLMTAPAEVNG